MSLCRSWTLTINNWTETEYDSIFNLQDKCSYILVGKEIGTEKEVPHIHAYMHFNNKVSASRIKKYLPRAHIEKVKGTPEQMRAYCVKDGNFREIGTLPKPGARTDLDSLKAAVKDGATFNQLLESHSQVVAQYPKFVHSYLDMVSNSNMEKESLPEPYPWQAELINYVQQKPDNRHIKWYYDPEGGHGKIHIARYLSDNFNAFYTNGGKAVDIAYNYDGQPIVIFDFVRESEEYINYGIIEAMKNGILTSNKYESKTKRFKSPHVIIFANFKPAERKFSKDRIELVEL